MSGEASVLKIFQSVGESLSERVNRRASYLSPWLNLIPRATFKQGAGLVQTTFTIANIEPTTHDESWANIALTVNGNDPGACAQTYNAVEVGFTSLTYRPEGYALKGPILCKEDQIYEHQAELFLRGYIGELAKRARRTYENRYESIYMQLASKCVITGTGSYAPYDGTSKFWTGSAGQLAAPSSLQSTAPAADLNQDHLDELALELIRRGATNPNSDGWIQMGPEGPIFSLLLGPDVSKRLIKNDSVTGTRTDTRYADPSELMKRIGATRVLGNFRHVPNLFPPRFGFGQVVASCTSSTSVNITNATADAFKGVCVGMTVTGSGVQANTTIVSIGDDYKSLVLSLATTTTVAGTLSLTIGTVGQYTRVQTFETIAASVGKKSVLTKGYKQAIYEAAIVTSPDVFTSEIVKPVNSAAGVNWNPTNNMGDWMWVSGAQKFDPADLDPTEKRGAHVAEFKHAPRPEFPEFGFTIIYKRL